MSRSAPAWWAKKQNMVARPRTKAVYQILIIQHSYLTCQAIRSHPHFPFNKYNFSQNVTDMNIIL